MPSLSPQSSRAQGHGPDLKRGKEGEGGGHTQEDQGWGQRISCRYQLVFPSATGCCGCLHSVGKYCHWCRDLVYIVLMLSCKSNEAVPETCREKPCMQSSATDNETCFRCRFLLQMTRLESNRSHSELGSAKVPTDVLFGIMRTSPRPTRPSKLSIAWLGSSLQIKRALQSCNQHEKDLEGCS